MADDRSSGLELVEKALRLGDGKSGAHGLNNGTRHPCSRSPSDCGGSADCDDDRGWDRKTRAETKIHRESRINLSETKQFILAVKGRWGTGGMGTVYGRGCGAKRDPVGGTSMNEANVTERNKQLIKLNVAFLFNN